VKPTTEEAWNLTFQKDSDNDTKAILKCLERNPKAELSALESLLRRVPCSWVCSQPHWFTWKVCKRLDCLSFQSKGGGFALLPYSWHVGLFKEKTYTLHKSITS